MQSDVKTSVKNIVHYQQQVWRVILHACILLTKRDCVCSHFLPSHLSFLRACWKATLPPLHFVSEVEPDTPTSPNWTAGPAKQTDKIGLGPAVGGTDLERSSSGRDHTGDCKERRGIFEEGFVFLQTGYTRQSFKKDEFFHPAVAFCHDYRRKVTSAEICCAW